MKHKFNLDFVKEQIRKALNEVVEPESYNEERQNYYNWVREYNRKLIEEQNNYFKNL